MDAGDGSPAASPLDTLAAAFESRVVELQDLVLARSSTLLLPNPRSLNPRWVRSTDPTPVCSVPGDGAAGSRLRGRIGDCDGVTGAGHPPLPPGGA